MIAKSDVIILLISATALAAGIYRWQSNLAPVSSARSASSAPVAAVLDSSQAANAIANPTQPGALTSVATTNAAAGTANTGSTVNGAVATGSATTNDTRNVDVTNTVNTSAGIVVGNANQPASDNSQAAEPLYGSYRVQSGDYLGKIAETFGTTLVELRSINNITGSRIDIDQEILYPLPAN